MNTAFRSEQYGGSGVRDAIEVVQFEIFELGNTDILDYFLSHNGPNAEVERVQAEMIKNGYVTGLDQRRFAMSLLGDVKYALWLTDKEIAIRLYGEELDEYPTGPVVISDLGQEGILYGYYHMPLKVGWYLEATCDKTSLSSGKLQNP